MEGPGEPGAPPAQGLEAGQGDPQGEDPGKAGQVRADTHEKYKIGEFSACVRHV